MNKIRACNLAVVLAVMTVSMCLVCSCFGRKEMSNLVIVQNETFTMTGDSIIEDTVFAYAVSPSRT